MNGKGLLLVGVIAGAIFATTPQGKKVVQDVKGTVKDLWSRPDVQRTVNSAKAQVRDVPVVGDTIADAIGKTQP